MANKSGDPIAFWQQMVGEMQKNFSAFTRLRPMGVTPRASSDDPATGFGNGHKPMADLMENYFAGMNVPSRGQLTALNERLASIEGELSQTRALLKELLAATQAPLPVSKPPADLAPQLNEIKGLLDALLAASKSQPTTAPVDVKPDLNGIKDLLNELLAASKAPQSPAQPAVDVTPQLSEIKALIEQMLKAATIRDPAPTVAIEGELREIRALLDTLMKPVQPAEVEPKAEDPALKAAEPARPGKNRNKKHGGAPAEH
ncbi:hypothetical protein SSBR45G_73660 [Bradyrhizobium sp. SSBR45G]|uniref:hypothetical protein n=1 Tax=unclassified Bradyrhizobium TaxID=2631580 RepID=UPI002342AA48|nr:MULTISPECIES: hypothetical protein [unclassified Bradyrhizobium]GLH82457.1 hypothetical protein SSBR45G_73660 [Bradyrhizobium sp. SSBR45G]GLH89874.1 hypothetical protein SSBR45R_73350 [Bradyrhizobium sp. SSBR45R]